MLEMLSAFLGASFLLCLAPGPDNLFVLNQAARYGRRSGVWVTTGLCSGLLIHTSAVALGVVALLQQSPLALQTLMLFGASYLLWLAWGMLRAEASSLEADEQQSLPPLKLYLRGFVMNVSNPKVSLFFIAFLPQFVTPDAAPVWLQIWLLGMTFMLLTWLVFGGIAVLAGALKPWLLAHPEVMLWINRSCGLIFILLALRLLWAIVSP